MKKKAPKKNLPPPKALLLLGANMKMPRHQKTHPGRGGIAVSLAPLTPDQALAAALRVKPADVKKLGEAERTSKRWKEKHEG